MSPSVIEQPRVGQPISILASRFEANVEALAKRDGELARRLRAHRPEEAYFIAASGSRVILLRGTTPIADPVPPEEARRVCQSIFREARCDQPVCVVGVGYGWLWNSIYALPVKDVHYHPPLYFLCRSIEELYLVLHLQDWRKLLADARVQLFVGENAIEQFRGALLKNPRLALPRFSLDVDASLWPGGMDYQGLFDGVSAYRAEARRRAAERLCDTYEGIDDAAIGEKLRSGEKLRVAGFASNRTSFLQHSMRDWLAAFEQLGHQTRLLMEEHPHEVLEEGVFLEELADFRPDVLLLLNHYRAEASWLPKGPVSVMWIQDDMPHLFTAEAGGKQGKRDFVVGFGWEECTKRYGYAAERFLPARIGVNEQRFSPAIRPTAAEMKRHGCEVSYVGHASAPAAVLLQQCLRDAPGPNVARLVEETYRRLCAVYEAGGSITEPLFLRLMLEESAEALGLELPDAVANQVTTRLMQTVNNALFRHQSLEWLAEAGVNLHLYGKAWEEHPRLGKFARGVAENQTELRAIYQASRINLQLQPHGAVHQRLCDGLAAGGFFLMRYVGVDAAGLVYQRLWKFAEEKGVEDDATLARVATEGVRKDVASLGWLLPAADARADRAFLETLTRYAEEGFAPLRETIWPTGWQFERIYRPLWAWCREAGIETDQEIREGAPASIRPLLGRIGYFGASGKFPQGKFIASFLRRHAEEGFERFAGSVFPEQYERVVFRSREELVGKVRRYLNDEAARGEVVEGMREVVLERFTYRKVTERLLGRMGKSLAAGS